MPARDEAPWRPARYLAVVFTSATAEKPRLIDLGDAFEIDSLVAQVRTRITGRRELPQRSSGHSTPAATAPESAAAKLHHLVFAPLRGVFGDVSTLFIAADGDLARLPFQILPNGDGTQLIDHYTISYLTTARDLVRLGVVAQVAPGPPMVIAGPDFSLGEHAPTGKPLAPLTAAYQEGIEIGQVLQCSPLLAERAVKAALQHVRSPVILHLATHGFVLKHQPPLRPFEIRAGMTVMNEDPRRQTIVLDGITATPHRVVLADDSGFGRMSSYNLANPLLRAGLALAGANTWLNGGQPPPPAANGILTAHEVSDLDLNGTQLVVLSACDSALGEILPGEGVFGLQRSFILAGARTIVSTLWKIPDEPARILVNQFYQRLLAGQPRAAALRQAQLHLRSQGQPERAWAAFICHGDHRPLPQQAPSNAGKG